MRPDPRAVASVPLTVLAQGHGRTAACELWGEGDEGAAWPEELEGLARARPARRAQRAAGRCCARAALARIGAGRGPVAAQDDGPPAWPDGVTGSIAHTAGYACAVVGLLGDRRRLGVDAERVGVVTPDLDAQLFTGAERARLDGASGPDRAVVATAAFTLKEALYKAQYPLTGALLGFHDVEVVVEADCSAVLSPVTLAPPLRRLEWPVRAGWAVHGSVVLALVAAEGVPSRPGSTPG